MSDTHTAVISQSMYFPWPGFFNQIMLADTFVHYDDVCFSRGFYNRVQVKTPQSFSWMSVPLIKYSREKSIDQTIISYEENWIEKHRKSIIYSCNNAAYLDDALEIFDKVVNQKHVYLGELCRSCVVEVSKYLGIYDSLKFINVSELRVEGKSSQRLRDISQKLDANIYLTGHGALNYLEHDIFEKSEIMVKYMKYNIKDYNQNFNKFTPYVTILDAISHLGKNTTNIMLSSTVDWKFAVENKHLLR
jgi:hypothetical protein